jgi:hypothetical protein
MIVNNLQSNINNMLKHTKLTIIFSTSKCNFFPVYQKKPLTLFSYQVLQRLVYKEELREQAPRSSDNPPQGGKVPKPA